MSGDTQKDAAVVARLEEHFARMDRIAAEEKVEDAKWETIGRIKNGEIQVRK